MIKATYIVMTTTVITTTAEVRIAPSPMAACSQTNSPLEGGAGADDDEGDSDESDDGEDDGSIADDVIC